MEEVTTDEFPEDAAVRIQRANMALVQLTGLSLMTMPSVTVASAGSVGAVATYPCSALPMMQPAAASQIASVAEAALDAAMGAPSLGTVLGEAEGAVPTLAPAPASIVPDPKLICGADSPTNTILVHNMFDKDEETEDDWEEDIRLDFEEESAKYGKLLCVVVMHKETGGKIYASFETIDGAKGCAQNLAGRWFDKRQLRVEYVDEKAMPKMNTDI